MARRLRRTGVTTTSASAAIIAPGETARILYVNAGGESSERTVSVRSRYTSRAGIAYLRAYCHLRGEERTFRSDRILAVLSRHQTALPRPQPVRANPSAPGRPTRPRADRNAVLNRCLRFGLHDVASPSGSPAPATAKTGHS
jgi:predicted DNA-binding transcriptional regulator YafY